MVRMLLCCSPFTGTIYQTDEPIFFQSIRNPFVFRCIDGVLIDGNDRAISKTVYRWAAAFRAHYEAQNTDTNQTSWLMNTDRVADGTDSAPSLWVTAPGWPLTPSTLSVGQYVNNCSNGQSVWLQFVPSTVIKENIRLLSVLSSTEKAANVCYQEYDVPDGFPLELRQFLPNVKYRADTQRQDFICHYYYYYYY